LSLIDARRQTPSDDYDGSIWPYRVQGKHLLDDLGIQASADFGINNSGKFKYGGYMVGVFDGPGYNVSEANGNKIFSGTLPRTGRKPYRHEIWLRL